MLRERHGPQSTQHAFYLEVTVCSQPPSLTTISETALGFLAEAQIMFGHTQAAAARLWSHSVLPQHWLLSGDVID